MDQIQAASGQALRLMTLLERGRVAASSRPSISSALLCRYIKAFESGFRDLSEVQLSFMQSDGGLAPVDQFSGHKAILSGPAGG